MNRRVDTALYSLFCLLCVFFYVINGLMLPFGIAISGYILGFRSIGNNPLIKPFFMAILFWSIPNFIAVVGIKRQKTWGVVVGILISLLQLIPLWGIKSLSSIPSFTVFGLVGLVFCAGFILIKFISIKIKSSDKFK